MPADVQAAGLQPYEPLLGRRRSICSLWWRANRPTAVIPRAQAMNPKARSLFCAAVLMATAALVGLILTVGERGAAPAPVFPPPLAPTAVFLFGLVSLIPLVALYAESRRTPLDTAPPEEGSPPDRTVVCLLLALTFVGFTLRIAQVPNFGFGNDETLFLFAAGHASIADAFRDSLNHFHPPLNALVLHVLTRVSWDVTWIRMPSIVGGTLAIGLTFLFVRTLFGNLSGLVAAFLVTFSPSLILLSQVCRNYSPSLPFLLLSLYYLARYLSGGKPAHLYAFALFEWVAVLWHYALLPLLLGANAVLLGHLLFVDRRFSRVLAAVLAQLPTGIVLVIARLFHQPLMQQGKHEEILEYMAAEYNLDLLNPARPLFSLIRYLLANSPDPGYTALALLMLIGALVPVYFLLRLRLRWQALLCLSAIPFSYLFAFGLKLMPFGGTRHSFFVFPTIFALIGSGAALAALGRRRFLAQIPGPGPIASGAGSARRASPLAATILALLGALYLYGSLSLYADIVPFELRQLAVHRERQVFYRAKFYKPIELPTRREDLELLTESILRYVKPGETILTSYCTMLILKTHLEERPAPVFFDLGQVIELEWEDRRFLYIPEAEFGFSPNRLMTAVASVAAERGLGKGERMWVALAGWEVWDFLWWGIRDAYPEALVPTPAVQESREALIALDVDTARRVAGSIP